MDTVFKELKEKVVYADPYAYQDAGEIQGILKNRIDKWDRKLISEYWDMEPLHSWGLVVNSCYYYPVYFYHDLFTDVCGRSGSIRLKNSELTGFNPENKPIKSFAHYTETGDYRHWVPHQIVHPNTVEDCLLCDIDDNFHTESEWSMIEAGMVPKTMEIFMLR